MASRFYFPEVAAADVSPGVSAEWEHQETIVRRKLLTAADGSTLTTTAQNPDGADHIADQDVLHRQYISDPLAAQNISGTVKAQFQCRESHASDNLKLTIKVFVVDQAGTTIKETLLAITRQGTEPTTSIRNTSFAAAALAAADVEENDRLVIEVGLGGLPTSGGGANAPKGSLRFGCNASSGDLLENETEAGTTFRPWLEFSQTIAFPAVASVRRR